ncbi:HK97 gp10 family phage protein [Lachnospira eligens]|uniref:HK97 gp10 family phage protein n=1 Tax=Lachnospira eligens TaxID=39485 RepID=A0A7C9LD40_9FIRM|nr:HK97 gp10 family phage protein [Lachnospira eligens]MSC57776.1 HK97 gp10 family phage protein [Lachnospira eligens]
MSNENINTAGAAIAEALAEYDQEIADATKRITDEVAKEAVDDLKKSSPKLTGSYRKGWRKKQSYADKRTKRNTVYNETDYQLTHLLEYGHASRNGGRVRAIQHIAPVEQAAIEALQERIEAAASK